MFKLKYLIVLCSVVLFGCGDSAKNNPQNESSIYKSHSSISESIGKVYTVSLNTEASEGRGEHIYFETYTANTHEYKSRGIRVNGTTFNTGSTEDFPVLDIFESVTATGELNFDSITNYDEAVTERLLVNNCNQSVGVAGDGLNTKGLDCYSERLGLSPLETGEEYYFGLLEETYKDGNTFLVEFAVDEYHLNSTRGKFTVYLLVEVDNFRKYKQGLDSNMINLRYKVLKVGSTTIIE